MKSVTDSVYCEMHAVKYIQLVTLTLQASVC